MITVKVIAQAGVVYDSADVKAVKLPTQMGTIKILPQHENLITTLDTGVISIEHSSGSFTDITLASGFAQIQADNLLILVDYADLAADLVKEKIADAIEAAEKKLSGTLAASELIQLEKMLRYERFKEGMVNKLR